MWWEKMTIGKLEVLKIVDTPFQVWQMFPKSKALLIVKILEIWKNKMEKKNFVYGLL